MRWRRRKKGGLGGSGIIQRRIKRLSLLEDIQKSVALPDGRKGWSVSGTLSLGVSRKWQGGSPPFELPKKNLFTVPVIRLWSGTEKPYDIIEKKSVYPSFSVTILDNFWKNQKYFFSPDFLSRKKRKKKKAYKKKKEKQNTKNKTLKAKK